MAYTVTSLLVFAVCHAQHARAVFQDVTHIGKAMPKAFVPTGHMPRRSGSMLVNRANAVAQAKSDAAPTFRFPVHEAPSSNQFDSALRMQEAQEQKEVVQHLRARVQPMPQADAKDAQYRFGFGILMFLMVSVGSVASIGTAVIQQYLARVQQRLESTIPGSVASDTNNRTKQRRRVWIWQTQHGRCPKPSLSASRRKRKIKTTKNTKQLIQSVVSISNPKTGQSVTLIGTNHVSAKSQQQVKQLIEILQPEAVMVELDPSRFRKMVHRLGYDSADEIRVARVTDSGDIGVPISTSPAIDKWLVEEKKVGILRKAIVGVLQLEKKLFYRRVRQHLRHDKTRLRTVRKKKDRIGQRLSAIDSIGWPGGDFLQAIRSAEDCTVCDTVILGDRHPETNKGRLAELAIESGEFFTSEWMSKLELGVRFFRKKLLREKWEASGDYTVDEVEVEAAMIKALKRDWQFRKQVRQFKASMGPEARLKERDYLMSESIRRELELHPEEVKTVVGVVGRNHIPGMERHFKTVFADEPAPLEQDIAAAAT